MKKYVLALATLSFVLHMHNAHAMQIAIPADATITFISKRNPNNTLTFSNTSGAVKTLLKHFKRVQDFTSEFTDNWQTSTHADIEILCEQNLRTNAHIDLELSLIQDMVTRLNNNSLPNFSELTNQQLIQLAWLADDLVCETLTQAIAAHYANNPERLTKREKTFKEKVLTFNKENVIDTDQLPVNIMLDICKHYYCINKEELIPQTFLQKIADKITTSRLARQTRIDQQTVHYENLVEYKILPKISDFMTPAELNQYATQTCNINFIAQFIINNITYLRNFINEQSPYYEKLMNVPDCPLANALAQQAKAYAKTHAHEATFHKWFNIIKQNEIIVTAALQGITERAKQEIVTHIKNNDLEAYSKSLPHNIFWKAIAIIAYIEHNKTLVQSLDEVFANIEYLNTWFPKLMLQRSDVKPNADGVASLGPVIAELLCQLIDKVTKSSINLSGSFDDHDDEDILHLVIHLYGKKIKVLNASTELPETIGQLKNLKILETVNYTGKYYVAHWPKSMKRLKKLFKIKNNNLSGAPAYLEPLIDKKFSENKVLNALAHIVKVLI